MTSTKITDEMVERFHRAYERNDWPVFDSVAPRIRAGLEAALTPPVPEIEVSEGMRATMRAVFKSFPWVWGDVELPPPDWYDAELNILARAMESTRLKEAQERLNRDVQIQGSAAYAAKDARQGASAARAEQTTCGWGRILPKT